MTEVIGNPEAELRIRAGGVNEVERDDLPTKLREGDRPSQLIDQLEVGNERTRCQAGRRC